MNKNIKHKNIKKIVTIFLVIIIAFGSKILYENCNNELNTEKNYQAINISEHRIKTIYDENIKNRRIRKVNHIVFIGETDKQIENGYYDVKTYIQNNKSIVVCFNKLWKQFVESLYEEDYIIEIVESIREILDINVPQNKIYDYIFSGYLVAKNSDISSDNDKEYVLDLGTYVIKGKILKKEFVMSIYKK